MEKAKRPIICAGGGVLLSEAEEELRAFAEEHRIPVVSTMMGIGVMPTEHPLYYGMVGNNGKAYANRAMNESDLLIMVGARVADRAVSQPDLITRNNEHAAQILPEKCSATDSQKESDDAVGDLVNFLVALGGNDDNLGTARLALHKVRHGLVVGGALGGHGDDGEARIDQCDGAVLHLAGGICLGVQVANLLELERALVGDGSAHTAAHKQCRLRVLAQQGGLVHGLGLRVQNPLDLLGRIGKLAEHHARLYSFRFSYADDTEVSE